MAERCQGKGLKLALADQDVVKGKHVCEQETGGVEQAEAGEGTCNQHLGKLCLGMGDGGCVM